MKKVLKFFSPGSGCQKTLDPDPHWGIRIRIETYADPQKQKNVKMLKCQNAITPKLFLTLFHQIHFPGRIGGRGTARCGEGDRPDGAEEGRYRSSSSSK